MRRVPLVALTRRRALAVYALLLLASHVFVSLRQRAPRPEGQGRLALAIPAQSDAGPVAGATTTLSVLAWPAAAAARSGAELPVVLLHGSPGSARNFETLGPLLAAQGRRALAVDLPGFGRSAGDVPSYSIRAHARATLALLDALAIERAHLVAWSMGGGVALEAASLAPERVASISLVASIGVQEAEGTGDYHFEHAKYAALWGALVALPEVAPHFGLFGARRDRVAFVRNFWDTDQRPLRCILERLAAPLLILHGEEDFLVPLWTAEETHRLVPGSRLVVLSASHFLPIGGTHGQARRTAAEIGTTLDAVDRGAPPPPPGRHDDAGVGERGGPPPFALQRALPAWLALALVLLAASLSWSAAGLACGWLVGALQLDFGLALLGCALAALGAPWRRGSGRTVRRRVLGLLGALGCVAAGAALHALVGTHLSAATGPWATLVLGTAAGAALGVLPKRVRRRG